MFLTLIKRKAERALSWTAYHAVCNTISTYKKACGKNWAGLIIVELQTAQAARELFWMILRGWCESCLSFLQSKPSFRASQ
jgi:hypothetical protein